MKKQKSNVTIACEIRRTWGNVNPCSKAFKSKKAYNRHNKSWKSED